MEQNFVERNFIVSFVLGLGVIMAMAFVGERIALVLLDYGIPYAEWIGVAIGIVVVFTAFVLLYSRYDRISRTE